MLQGTIVKAVGGFHDICGEDGVIYRCRARGRLKKDGINILVGDRVTFEPLAGQPGVLESVLPRGSELKRPPVANADQVVMICSPQEPPFSLQLLDRMLVLSESRQFSSVICMNKEDLSTGNEFDILSAVYSKTDYPVISTSALHGRGIDALARLLHGRVSVFAGQSGVGKSSLLNRVQVALTLRTGEVSEKIGRGRQTTRHVELIPLLRGGYVADTPGFNQLDLTGISPESLAGYFPEFDEFAKGCRFKSCRHKNEPGCAVKRGVEEGALHAERYRNYLTFFDEIKSCERSR